MLADDERPDDLIVECARKAFQQGIAVAWTAGITGDKAKRCSATGKQAWKNAEPFPNEAAAIGVYQSRARWSNPCTVLSASGLVGIEADGDLDELCDRFGITLPPSPIAVVRSRRGLHLYYRPPIGRGPMKVQLDEAGVTVSSDGYLVGAGALHPSGWVYRYESLNGHG